MDEVNINKYLGQFNPILIVPVLSAVFGAILVFVFGFKRPNEPRFQSSSDSLKKSKRKANAAKSTDNAVQSSKQSNPSAAKVSNGKKPGDATSGVAVGKKGTGGNEKSSGASNNNNNTSSNNNNINKKKTDEKKSENGSPTKKIASKKIGKESIGAANKKSKTGKGNLSDDKEYDEKPIDFDDGGWFTVQSKSGKQKNKVDETAAAAAAAVNTAETASPKSQQVKATNKSVKTTKTDTIKPSTPATDTAAVATAAKEIIELSTVPENVVAVENNSADQTAVEIKEISIPEIVPELSTINNIEIVEKIEKDIVGTTSTIPPNPVIESSTTGVDNAIVFDEMGEWTDAKPDRKRGNKKKTRKD